MKNTDKEDFEILKKLLKNSYSPYSNFRVGAVLYTVKNKKFKGVNIENSSFSLTICAERAALFNAITNGYRTFKKLLLINDTKNIIVPCGSCLQVLSEFCDKEFPIFSYNIDGDYNRYLLKDLLPNSFNFNKKN